MVAIFDEVDFADFIHFNWGQGHLLNVRPVNGFPARAAALSAGQESAVKIAVAAY